MALFQLKRRWAINYVILPTALYKVTVIIAIRTCLFTNTLPYLTLPYLTLPYTTLPYITLPYLT